MGKRIYNKATTSRSCRFGKFKLYYERLGDWYECRNDNRIGYLIDPPKKEDISDIIKWNKKHGIIWIVYGICIELGFWLGYVMPIEVLEMVFMMGGVIIPLPIMVIMHHKLEKEYKLN